MSRRASILVVLTTILVYSAAAAAQAGPEDRTPPTGTLAAALGLADPAEVAARLQRAASAQAASAAPSVLPLGAAVAKLDTWAASVDGAALLGGVGVTGGAACAAQLQKQVAEANTETPACLQLSLGSAPPPAELPTALLLPSARDNQDSAAEAAAATPAGVFGEIRDAVEQICKPALGELSSFCSKHNTKYPDMKAALRGTLKFKTVSVCDAMVGGANVAQALSRLRKTCGCMDKLKAATDMLDDAEDFSSLSQEQKSRLISGTVQAVACAEEVFGNVRSNEVEVMTRVNTTYNVPGIKNCYSSNGPGMACFEPVCFNITWLPEIGQVFANDLGLRIVWCIWGNKDDCELIGQLLLDFAKNSFDALMGLLNSELDCVLDLFTAPFQLMPALASSITRLAPANNLITMYTNLYTQLQQGGYCNGRDDCIAKFPNLKAQFGALDSMVLLYAAVAGATQTVADITARMQQAQKLLDVARQLRELDLTLDAPSLGSVIKDYKKLKQLGKLNPVSQLKEFADTLEDIQKLPGMIESFGKIVKDGSLMNTARALVLAPVLLSDTLPKAMLADANRVCDANAESTECLLGAALYLYMASWPCQQLTQSTSSDCSLGSAQPGSVIGAVSGLATSLSRIYPLSPQTKRSYKVTFEVTKPRPLTIHREVTVVVDWPGLEKKSVRVLGQKIGYYAPKLTRKSYTITLPNSHRVGIAAGVMFEDCEGCDA